MFLISRLKSSSLSSFCTTCEIISAINHKAIPAHAHWSSPYPPKHGRPGLYQHSSLCRCSESLYTHLHHWSYSYKALCLIYKHQHQGFNAELGKAKSSSLVINDLLCLSQGPMLCFHLEDIFQHYVTGSLLHLCTQGCTKMCMPCQSVLPWYI